ncbi:MAG: ABC transporter ATP-binding protein [Bdellovibrionaceae bacterium]|jgi:oligopeptide/dipeptide ABC transporter ATP-binding protein|nr:ABC transporter ATP-binding protein [Pseudobdellovibrionaceae bacterium]
MSTEEVLLKVKDLVTEFDTEAGTVRVLDKVSFNLHKGQTLGIVGESGCGKSVTSMSIMRLLPRPSGHIRGGEILFHGEDLTKKPIDQMYKIRGKKIAMIFQEPMTALNPVHKVGQQIGEVFELHFPQMKNNEVKDKSQELLEKVGIPDARRRLNEYPHQLSGGIRQRVMIAMALACEPDLLIADEPTTALDVTIQSQILRLIKDMQKEYGMGIIFITHDLGVIAEVSDEVAVMYAGKVVEQASVFDIFKKPMHPYTKGLLSSIPRIDHPSKTALSTIEGMVPDLFHLPKGCRFENRCDYSTDTCKEISPDLEPRGENHLVSCIYKGDL